MNYEIDPKEYDEAFGYDLDAIEEAELILSGKIPSTPETYQLVKEWYGGGMVTV